MLSKEERIESKAAKKAENKARKNPKPWYKPFDWVPPVIEKILDAKKRERIIVKSHGYFQLNHPPKTQITDSNGRIYEVQKSGALKCLNKEPSKRDLHRAGVK